MAIEFDMQKNTPHLSFSAQNAHVVTVPIDSTLTQRGSAADAKSTGDAISGAAQTINTRIDNEVNALEDIIDGVSQTLNTRIDGVVDDIETEITDNCGALSDRLLTAETDITMLTEDLDDTKDDVETVENLVLHTIRRINNTYYVHDADLQTGNIQMPVAGDTVGLKQISFYILTGETSKTVSDADVYADMAVLACYVAPATAQAGEWTFTTGAGSVSWSGAVTADCAVSVILGDSGAAVMHSVNQMQNSKVNEPAAEGTPGQVLATDGYGTRYWKDAGGGGAGGTSDYLDLTHKPAINGVTLAGDKSGAQFGLISEPTTEGTNGQVLTTDGNGGRSWTTAQGGGGSSDYSALTNKPQINGETLTGNKTASAFGLADKTHSHSQNDITGLSTALNGKVNEPATDGTAGQVLATDGQGGRLWATVQGGGGGTSDYSLLTNKPQIGGVTLSGDKSAASLGLAEATHTHAQSDITGLSTALAAKMDTPVTGTAGQVLSLNPNGVPTWTTRGLDFSATLTGWTQTADGYEKGITCLGMLSTDVPIVDVDTSGADASTIDGLLQAWGMVHCFVSGSDTLTAKCYGNAPSVSVPITVKVVR